MREVGQYPLGLDNRPLQVVAPRDAAAYHFGRQIACRPGARLAHLDGLRVRVKHLQKLVAILARHRSLRIAVDQVANAAEDRPFLTTAAPDTRSGLRDAARQTTQGQRLQPDVAGTA